MTIETPTYEQFKEQARAATRNKANAVAYYQALMGDRDWETARKYVAEYIQHDPEVEGDGLDPLIHYLETDPKYKDMPPMGKVEPACLIGEGDFVYFQIRDELENDGSTKSLVQHVFRFNDAGLISEHWTTITTIDLSGTVNPHPLY